MSRLLRRLPGERGQVLWAAALLLPVLLGMTGMAMDIGGYAAERRSLQNAADSIALAAGQGLPDEGEALAIADEWAAKNNVDPSVFTVTVSGGDVSPAVTVQIDENHEFAFMRVLGITDRAVGARAVAGKFSTGSGSGVVPWSIEQEFADNATSGDIVTVKYDSGGASPGSGNFGAIRIDGNGASDYEDAATWGSDSILCTTTAPNCDPDDCPGVFPTGCAETAPECDGDECRPKTGNMTGATRDAVDFRMDNTSNTCDTFEEAFTQVSVALEGSILDALVSARGFAPEHHGAGSHPTFTPTPTRTPTPGAPSPTNTPVPPGSTPTSTLTPGGSSPTPTSTGGGGSGGGGSQYALNPACNPWGAGACPPAPTSALCSRRVFLIPVIDQFGNGSSDDVKILRFALVYLEGYEGSCTGNSCDVRVRLVRADLTTDSVAADYDPNSHINFVKLIE